MSEMLRGVRRSVSGTRRWRTPVVAATVPAVVATLAVLYPGVPVSQVDLNDGAVWLTSSTALKLGRYNPQVDELNAGLISTSNELDVLQDAQDVLLTEPGRVSVVDPAAVTIAATTAIPFDARVTMADGTVAVADPTTGQAWARTVATLGALDVDSQAADLELGPGGRAVTADGGDVLGVQLDGTLWRAEVGDGGAEVASDGALSGVPTSGLGEIDQVTAVGPELVVLSGGTVHTRTGSLDLNRYGDDLVLQQPGPAARDVLVAGRTALLEVPIAGGPARVVETGGSGLPAAPVRVGTCGHGAWASATGSYAQLCDGVAPEVTDLSSMTTADRLVFRVNRDVVVLNDTLNGRLWQPLQDPDLREPNWQEIDPDEESEQDDEESQVRESDQTLETQCTAQSSAPSATDDSYGVRAGRTIILSVIDNDASSDCGILAVSEFDPLPEDFGTLVPVHGGRAFQLTMSPGATGSAEFTYTITDGRGSAAPSTASVRLSVHGPGVNGPPEQVRVGSMVVEQGGSITYDLLADFTDPDGDHLILSGATVADGGGTVRARQDGQLTFQSDGGSLGRHTVQVTVSDGTEAVTGTVLVDVRPPGSVPPLIEPVQAVTYVGQPVLVRPLKSVRSSTREPVRLAGVEEVQGADLTTDLTAGTFTFSAAQAGTFYVTFVVAAAPTQATGIARIDVLERPEQNPPPTAVLDVALLPPGGEVTIDPLVNDVDPGGAVLVVQSVDVPTETGLRIAVIGHQLLRISSTRTLTEAVTATYTISNGAASATGQVLVQPIPAAATQQAPVVPNVTATVRTGGVVTIPVLEGAYDPDGEPLTLVRDLAEPLGAGQGLLFVSGDVLRYQAPARPMEVHGTFSVSDAAGNVTAASVTVSVHASDAASKEPPRPKNLTARVFEGETIRIPVPLTGIDPDGDGVSLLGPDQAPVKGRITTQGADWLEYEALPGELGTDTFTYAVEDWVGQRAVATIRVGIAARPTTSAEVVSRNDDVTVRPGQSVEVRVLANDTDTGGGELALDPLLEHAEGIDARIEGRRIVVQTPAEPGVLQITYTATNERGGRDSAVLTVTVSADAPILAPIAHDVVVPATETINRTSVEVDVLALAENPSGPLSDLAVSVDSSVADVATVTGRGTVVVTLVDRPQTLPYLLTNTTEQAGGLSSYAFITVPALGDFPPMLRPGAPELMVIAGETLRIPLEEQVQVGPGRTARITDRAKVSATKSDGSDLVVDDRTLVYTPQRSYAGPASISFEVTDGATGDTGARRTVLTLPITVLAAEDYPPTFAPSVIDVGPGESTRVDLASFTSAPVGTATGTEQYTFRVTSSPPPGFQVTLDGSELTVSTNPAVRKGTAGGVSLEIGYGRSGSLTAQVDFRVVASSRALARLVDHVVPDGVEGAATTVAALEGASNPFPGTPLTLVDAVVETPGSGTAEVSGSQVTVRPAAGFIGQMVTRYSVRDATGDLDRQVEGRITVTVRGRPAAPTAPRAVEVRDGTVVLAWDAPVNNGEAITGYRVTAQPGGIARDCASTTCTIDGLTNDTEYTFTVTARNVVGVSDPSPASAPARPDAKPAAPATPGLVWGNQSVTASWGAPQNPGSPITRYELEISPAPPGGSVGASTSSTSYTFGGLANGTEYRVRVRAVNDAPDPGDWSGFSAAQVPAAAPDVPVAVQATRGQVGVGDRTITVTWAPGAANGDPVSAFEVQVNGAVTGLGAEARSFTFDAVQGRAYDIAVRASNKAGWSPWASTTGEIWTAPGPVTGLTATDVGTAEDAYGDGRLGLRWVAPTQTGGQGVTLTGYRVVVDGVAEYRTAATSLEIDGLTPGGHSVQVFVTNSRGIESDGTGTTVTLITVPQAVTSVNADTTTPEKVVFSWVPGGTGGSPITGYRYLVTDQAGATVASGQQDGVSLTLAGRPAGEVLTITVWVRNVRGESAGSVPRSAVVLAPPPAPPSTPPPDSTGSGAAP